MGPGRFSTRSDRTGFPLVTRGDWPFWVSLFPVSKYQFESYLADAGNVRPPDTDAWYRALLEKNPRCTWREPGKAPWRLFLTGIDDEGARGFLRHLGDRFRLPAEAEWKLLLECAGELRADPGVAAACAAPGAAPPAAAWAKSGLFPLVEEGMLELVTRGEERVCCIGRPWQGLFKNTWRPGTVRDVNRELCAQMIGFRAAVDNG